MSRRKEVLAVMLVEDCSGKQPSGKKMKFTKKPIAFNDDDLEGIIQPYDDALVVTTKINGFIVKRVMVDQGSGDQCGVSGPVQRARVEGQRPFEIHTPLVGFDGHMVILEGQISLPLNMEGKEVVVTFIVVTSFSPNTVILGRPWIHPMGAVPSTLHVKVNFRTE